MNKILNEKLDEYKYMILGYLFNSDMDIIKKWEDNKKIKINNNFKPLLQGDWTRDYKLKEDRLNLDKLLGNNVTKNYIFEILIKELKIKSIKNNYSQNFNPNWFFLFYQEFYDDEIDFIPVFDRNEIIKGIIFDNKNIRIETIKIIELHSRFILNSNYILILGQDKFIEYFIKNCLIQQKIKDNNRNYKYIDLCYII